MPCARPKHDGAQGQPTCGLPTHVNSLAACGLISLLLFAVLGERLFDHERNRKGEHSGRECRCSASGRNTPNRHRLSRHPTKTSLVSVASDGSPVGFNNLEGGLRVLLHLVFRREAAAQTWAPSWVMSWPYLPGRTTAPETASWIEPGL